MTDIKRPASLRAGNFSFPKKSTSNTKQKIKAAASSAVITTALTASLYSSVSTVAMAQSADPTPLPELNVETTVAKPKPKKKEPAKKKQPAQAPQVQADIYDGQTNKDGAPLTPGANPYAQAGSPYKVNHSANGKFTEPVVNTPKTINTVPKEVLDDKQATSIRELSRTTPGVTLGFGEGGSVFGDNLYIRGFRANNDAYIDGVRDPGTGSRESFMIEQVEILKGPSSSIGGRGTTGGALNVITKEAQEEEFAIGELTIGTDETVRTTLDANYVFDDKFQLRLGGMWQEADVAGRDNVFDNRWGLNGSAKWKPTNFLNFTLNYYHLDLDQMPDWGVPYNNDANKPWTETGLDRDTFYGAVGRDFQEGEQDVGTLKTELDIDKDTKLTNKFRLSRSTSDYVVSAPGGVDTSAADPDDWTVGVSYKSNHQITDVIANQTDLSTKLDIIGLEHSVVTGVEFSKEESSKVGYDGLVSESFGGGRASCSLSLFSPSYPGVGTGCWDGVVAPTLSTNPPTETQIDTKSWYLLDTIKITDQLLINGGVRIDHYEIARDGYDGRALASYSLSREDTMVNWNGGIVYKPMPNGSIYASVATSSNPVGEEIEGGGGFYGGLDTAQLLLDPEENTAYELGTKWEFNDKKFLVTAALFQTEKDKARESGGFGQPYDDTGKYRIRGVEFGVAGNITEYLSLYGGTVFMESEILESADADAVGEKLANIAHRSFNLLAKYEFTEWLTLGGQATYNSDIALGSLADNGREVPSSWRFDALAEVDVTKNVELQLNVQNIFDDIVYDAGYRSGSPFVYIAPGRAAYAKLKVKY